MKTAPEIDSDLLVDSKPLNGVITSLPHHAELIDEQRPEAAKRHAAPAARAKKLPELTTFRALSRHVFGAEAGREYIQEAILFASMTVAAAWPLSVTLNQLGTMMISPPNALW